MCFDDDAHPPIPLSDNSAVRGEDLLLTSQDGTKVMAYLASSDGEPIAQTVILPDVRGLHRFYRELALRFADAGVRAMAIDYFGRTAESDSRTDDFEYMQHVPRMTPEGFRLDLNAAIDYLQRGTGAGLPTFTVGFCMGGTLSFWAGTGDRPLNGVVGFYAGLTRQRGAVTPAVDWASRIKAPLLGLFGGADEGIPRTDIERFERGLTEGGVEHEIVVYPGAPHSFFDKRATDFSLESADAWTRIQEFIRRERVPVGV